MELVEVSLALGGHVIKTVVIVIANLCHGEGFDQFVLHVITVFKTVSLKKPGASRAKSLEVYLVAKGLIAN